MNPNPDRMAKLQFFAAVVILFLLAVMIIGPMVGLKPPDQAFVELMKAAVLILVGFLFGTSVSGAKKDDRAAALTAQLAAAPTLEAKDPP